jgi:hypothetical protein
LWAPVLEILYSAYLYLRRVDIDPVVWKQVVLEAMAWQNGDNRRGEGTVSQELESGEWQERVTRARRLMLTQ